MKTEIKQRIRELVERDAPDTSVIAVWAGYEVTRWQNKQHDHHYAWSVWDGDDWVDGDVFVRGNNVDPISENTLRRWLLDGEVGGYYNTINDGRYDCSFVSNGFPEKWGINDTGYGDSPEEAFTDCVHQFAEWLRSEAK
jgi:hypothetical protein